MNNHNNIMKNYFINNKFIIVCLYVRNGIDDSFLHDFNPLSPQALTNGFYNNYNLKVFTSNNLDIDEDKNKLVFFLIF